MKRKILKPSLAITSLYLTTFSTSLAACADSNPNCVDTPVKTLTPLDVLLKVTSWVLTFAGAAAVLFIIYGGIVYISSAGNDKRAEEAKKILTYAVVGLIVIVLADVIVVFVKTGVTSVLNTKI